MRLGQPVGSPNRLAETTLAMPLWASKAPPRRI
jgi:hypothetical protein